MRVLLVCVAGITTTVLAGRLQSTGQAMGRHDSFSARKIGMAEELLNQYDLVLAAPQAKGFLEPLEKECRQKNIPLVSLNEEEFALQQTDRIYEKMLDAMKDAHNREIQDSDRRYLNGKDMLHLLLFSAVRCLPVLLLGAVFYLLYAAGFSVFRVPVLGTAGIVSLLFLLCMGYEYGKATSQNPLTSALFCLIGPLILLPVYSQSQQLVLGVSESEGYVPLFWLGLPALPAALLLSVLSIFLLDLTRRIHPEKKAGISGYEYTSLSWQSLRGGLVLAVFLLLRLLISRVFCL